jgi:hypothetical protein
MTEQEAINVLDGFRKAFRALDRTKAMRAFNALLITGKVVTTADNLAREFGSALATLRTVFDAMDNKGFRFPSN